MTTIREFIQQRPTALVHHYTGAAAAISILQKKQLWASKIRHLNDASEFLHAKSWLLNELKRRDEAGAASAISAALSDPAMLTGNDLGRSVVRTSENTIPLYVLSFSAVENLLSQWRAYCPGGDGYSFGFDLSDVPCDPFRGMQVVKCVYTDGERQDLCSALIASWKDCDPHSQGDVAQLYSNSLAIMAALKHESFSEEQEWRVISISPGKVKFRKGRHGIVPYTEVPISPDGFPRLKKIWIGPNSDEDAAGAALSLILQASDHSDVEQVKSDTPLRR